MTAASTSRIRVLESCAANTMRFAVLFALVALAVAKPMSFNKGNPAYKALTQEIVDYVNAQRTTWRAAMSDRFQGMTEDYVRSLCGAYMTGGIELPATDIQVRDDVPDTFDARTQWPNCPSISDIRDQGSCGSCWVSDRVYYCLVAVVLLLRVYISGFQNLLLPWRPGLVMRFIPLSFS